MNLGGQLIPVEEFQKFRTAVKNGKIQSWPEVHSFYSRQAEQYDENLFEHAIASLREISGTASKWKPQDVIALLKEGIETFTWINTGIVESRKKDYENPFRKMVYEDDKEMNSVLGSLDENSFILHKQEELSTFTRETKKIISNLKK